MNGENVKLVGQNVAMMVDAKTGKILIEIDGNGKGVPSKSGKSTVHASTHGNVPLAVNGKVMKLGLNLFE